MIEEATVFSPILVDRKAIAHAKASGIGAPPPIVFRSGE
jgi:hypothetical protein